MTNALVTQSSVPAELQEKVLLGGDLARLTPPERLSYYNALCTSIGINPLSRPFEYLTLDDKLVLYARKDCTDQLRELHGVSVEILSREVIDGVCVVTVRAKNMTERTDESLGAVPFMKEDGEWKSTTSGKRYFAGTGTYKPLGLEARSNAMMKAETKAKRRVTLSICGLGMFDETELEAIPGVRLEAAPGARIGGPAPKATEILARLEAQEKALPEIVHPEPTVAQPEAFPVGGMEEDYKNKIALSETIQECNSVVTAVKADTYLSVFDQTALIELGRQKTLALRSAAKK